MDPNWNQEPVKKESSYRKPQTSASNGRIYTTWIVGFATLMIGLVTGYIGRGAFGPEAAAVRTTSTANAVATQTGAIAAAAAAQTQMAANAEVMELLIAQTRHFKGQADAPVTLIEFSDFK